MSGIGGTGGVPLSHLPEAEEPAAAEPAHGGAAFGAVVARGGAAPGAAGELPAMPTFGSLRGGAMPALARGAEMPASASPLRAGLPAEPSARAAAAAATPAARGVAPAAPAAGSGPTVAGAPILAAPRLDARVGGWASPQAGAAAGAPTEHGADGPILAPPPQAGSAAAFGWAADPASAASAGRPPLSPGAAQLLAALKGELGDDPAMAAAVLAHAKPADAAAALGALAGEGRLPAMLATAILAEMPPEVQAALLPHLEAALPPDVRDAVLAAVAPPGGFADAVEVSDADAVGWGSVQDAPLTAEAAALAPGQSASPAEVKAVLSQALSLAATARAGGGGDDAAAVALGAALGGLAALLKGDPADARIVVNDVFEPKAAYVLAQHEDRGAAGGGSGGGASDDALEMMAAMRSLDFAGLKAVALDRAASRAASLRGEASEGDPAAVAEYERVCEGAALLLASDPAGIARFGREHPEVFPSASARNLLGELLRPADRGTRRALGATAAHLLRPVETGDATEKAHAAGWLAGAGAAAASHAAAEPDAGRDLAGRLLATLSAARSLACGIEPSPGGPADRDQALRLLDERGAELDLALYSADAEAGPLASTTSLLDRVAADLATHFLARDPGNETGLIQELEAGLAPFRRR